jgi:hypothetical protein
MGLRILKSKKMKTRNILLPIAILFYLASYVSGCKSSQVVAMKTGAQLWGENCIRCHNVPSPSIYSDQQWDLVTTHMKVRGNLTAQETLKIKEFLQMAN